MRRHAEAGHVDADDAHAVDLLRQQIQRYAGRRGHAQIDHHHGVVIRRLRRLEHRVADVLVQLPAHQRLGVERHVADGSLGAVEMRGEGQPVHAAGRATQDRRHAAHAQTHAQRAKRGAHRLRLVVRATRIVRLQPVQRLALAGRAGGLQHRLAAAMAAAAGRGRERTVHVRRHPRRSLPATAASAATARTCRPLSPAPARRRGRPHRP